MTITPARPTRPTQVTVAFWLQLAAAFLLFCLVGLAVASAVYFDGEISRAAELVPDADPAEVSDERTGNVVGAVVTGGLPLLLALWLAATAVPTLRGSNVGRILVFVAAGGQLLLCGLQVCGAALFLPLAFSAEGEEFPGTGEVPWEESKFLDTLYAEPDPFLDIFFPAAGLGAFVVILLVGTVALLLALPPAHRYFVPRADPPAPAWPGRPAGHPLSAGPAWSAGHTLPAGPGLPAGYPPPFGYAAPFGCPAPVSYPPAPGYPAPVPYPICPDPAAHVPPAAQPPDPAAPPPAEAGPSGPPADPTHGR